MSCEGQGVSCEGQGVSCEGSVHLEMVVLHIYCRMKWGGGGGTRMKCNQLKLSNHT